MRKLLLISVLTIMAAACVKQAAPFHSLASEERDGYSVHLVSIGEIPAYLLVPAGADAEHPGPAILMLHDHGARFDIGKEKLVHPLADSPDYIKKSAGQWVDKNFEGVFLGDSLCSLGYVVLVPDALYWGGRSCEEAQRWARLTFLEGAETDLQHRSDTIRALKDRVYEGQREVYAQCVESRGKEWAEVILEDDLAALDWLSALPFVDPDRIASFGFSMGAHRSWFLAANTDRLRCAVAQNWMTSLAAADTTSASSLSMSVKRLRGRMDIPEIAAQASPTPMLLIAGERDHLFPRDTVARCFALMQGMYEKDMLRTEFFDGEHECPKRVQAVVAAYLDEMLR